MAIHIGRMYKVIQQYPTNTPVNVDYLSDWNTLVSMDVASVCK